MQPEITRGVARIREAVDEHGLLLLHDAALPSVTTMLAGEPIRGSWWGHQKGTLIWEVLQVVDEEVATAKLVTGKVTLVAARLWPALAAVGAERADWQLRGLPEEAEPILAAIGKRDRLRSDALLAEAEGNARKRVKRAIDTIEKRLLAYMEQIHSESGKHVRVLTSWSRFVDERGLEPPGAVQARDSLEACVAGWNAASGKRLLPW